MRALAYLQLRLLKNGILSVLRSPKRLAFALVFMGWLGLSMMLGIVGLVSGRSLEGARLFIPADHVHLAVVCLLALLTLAAIERALQGAVLSFTPADYDFLFPTPVSRRLVIASRVLLDAVTIGFWVAIVVLFAAAFLPMYTLMEVPGRGVLLMGLAGWLYALFVINLARILELLLTGARGPRAGALGAGKTVVWLAVLAILAGTAYLLGWGGDAVGAAAQVLSQPPVSVIFLPMLAVASFVTGAAPPVAGSEAATFGLLVALAAASSLTVCFLDRDVVEATIGHSRRLSRMKAASREQDVERMVGERLREQAGAYRSLVVSWRSPDLALPYKALAEASHGGRLRWLGYALLLAAPAVAARLLPLEPEVLRHVPGPVVAYLLLLVAGFHALRFRSELNHIALLRAAPAAPWRQLLGLVLPRAAAYAVFLVAAVAAFWLGNPMKPADTHLAVALSVPLATVATLLVSVIATCLFPHNTDPAQRFLGGLLLTFGVSLALTLCVIALVVGALFGLPGLVMALLGNLALVPPAAGALALAAFLYGRFEPGDE